MYKHIIDTDREIDKKLSPSPRIAAPRARTRNAESEACLTSSPDKRSLVDKAADQKRKKKTKAVRTASGKKRKTKKQATPESSDDEDKAWPCLVCGEPFSSSKSRGKWVQCQMCKKWAHEQCTPGYNRFICPSCQSDEN